jgi:hypothetical protein
MYLLPWRGLLTLQNGTFEGYPCVTAVHNLTDGRRVVSTRPAGTTAFHSGALGLSGEPVIVTFQNASLGIARGLHILDGRLAPLHSVEEAPVTRTVFPFRPVICENHLIGSGIKGRGRGMV